MPNGERRLSAIMFSDMVGYTTMGQRDEALSLSLVDELRRLVKPVLARHRGREVKTMGDGYLVEFGSALDATNCAMELQKSLHEHNLKAKVPILLRVGVHVGDVVHRGGDMFGDAVNIASRIEPLAEPGGVCISEQVFDQVRNKVRVQLVKLEGRELKGVSFPVDVYKIQLPWVKKPKGEDDQPMISVARKSPAGKKAYSRQTIGNILLKMSMKDRIMVVKVTNDPSVPLLLAKFSQEVDYGRGETLHIVTAGETVTVVIDSKNLEKLKKVIPRRNVIGIYRDLAEINIAFSEEMMFTPGGVATVAGELSRNGIVIFEFFTSTPNGIILVSENEALRSYQLLRRLSD